jgi:hypothetical protein
VPDLGHDLRHGRSRRDRYPGIGLRSSRFERPIAEYARRDSKGQPIAEYAGRGCIGQAGA